MAAAQWFNSLSALFKLLVLNRRTPLFVAWNLTFRCNLSCLYCGAGDVKETELGAGDICRGLDELWALGARWITFGGGEPLLRDDIGLILGHAKRRGFKVFVSTNGTLAREKAEALRQADHVNLSLDGDRETHDRIRGKGSFDKAMDALDACRGIGVPVSLVCVLSARNLDQAGAVLEIAAKNRLLVMFQPATSKLNSSSRANPLAPPAEAYRAAVRGLIALKKQGAPVRNSFTALRHLAKWPDPACIFCPGGRMMAVIESDGAMRACHLEQTPAAPEPPEGGGMKARFGALPLPLHCTRCWCAPLVELSLIRSLRPEAIWNAFRLLR